MCTSFFSCKRMWVLVLHSKTENTHYTHAHAHTHTHTYSSTHQHSQSAKLALSRTYSMQRHNFWHDCHSCWSSHPLFTSSSSSSGSTVGSLWQVFWWKPHACIQSGSFGRLRQSPLNSSACCVFFIPCGFRNYVRGRSRRSRRRDRRERPLHYIENVEGPVKRFPPVSLSYPLNFPKSIMQLFPHPPLSLSTLRQECVRRPSERERTSGSLVHHSHPRTADSLSLALSLFLPLPEKVKTWGVRAFKHTQVKKKRACYCFLLPAGLTPLHVSACMNARVWHLGRESVCVCVSVSVQRGAPCRPGPLSKEPLSSKGGSCHWEKGLSPEATRPPPLTISGFSLSALRFNRPCQVRDFFFSHPESSHFSD